MWYLLVAVLAILAINSVLPVRHETLIDYSVFKEKIRQDIQPSLPAGVKIVTTYDRSDLILRAIDTLKEEIIKLSLAVSVVCAVFLFHLPSALVVILTLPAAIVISFLCMYFLGISSNIMSMSGIAIAIGAMVDATIIMVENAHKKLEEWEAAGRPGSRTEGIVAAARAAGIPVLRNAPVARSLLACELGSAIPERLYEAVAEVLRIVLDEDPG